MCPRANTPNPSKSKSRSPEHALRWHYRARASMTGDQEARASNNCDPIEKVRCETHKSNFVFSCQQPLKQTPRPTRSLDREMITKKCIRRAAPKRCLQEWRPPILPCEARRTNGLR